MTSTSTAEVALGVWLYPTPDDDTVTLQVHASAVRLSPADVRALIEALMDHDQWVTP